MARKEDDIPMPSAVSRARARLDIDPPKIPVGPSPMGTPDMRPYVPPDPVPVASGDSGRPAAEPSPLVKSELAEKERKPLSRPPGKS